MCAFVANGGFSLGGEEKIEEEEGQRGTIADKERP